MNNDNINSVKLDSLTSLRFFAALVVFMHHISTITLFSDGSLNYIKDFFNEGKIGVTFFYVLSGFIISYSYKDRLVSKQISKLKFILNRLARIYPVFILTFFIAIVTYHGSLYVNMPTILKFVMNTLLIQSWYPSVETAFSFNGVAWSLSVEMFFYSSFMLLCILNIKNVFALLVSLISIILFFQSSHWFAENFNHIDRIWLFYVNPLFRIVDFLSGIIIYLVYKKIKNYNINFIFSSIIEVLSLVLLSFFLLMKDIVTPESRLDIYYVIPMALIILIFSISTGIVSKLLSIKPLVFLGEVSFSFYMIHQIVYNYYLMHVTFKIENIRDFIYSSTFIFIMSISVAIVIYLFYEKPLNKILRKMIRRSELVAN